ncbi:MAG: Chromosomal replication initiator protein DnaA [candidate division BRC1 bacterium ADurb.BinA364]|nr:MAG: Chromosomal replication initiator protein DnaA [candidate division BRC1 bacterium ADurb.BinA364]
MERLERRLVSRFAAGVVVDIQPPDLETRIAILQRAIKNIADIKPPDDAIAALAERLPSNVRELKGALSQLLAMARIGGGADSEADWMRMADSVLERR